MGSERKYRVSEPHAVIAPTPSGSAGSITRADSPIIPAVRSSPTRPPPANCPSSFRCAEVHGDERYLPVASSIWRLLGADRYRNDLEGLDPAEVVDVDGVRRQVVCDRD